MKRFARVFSAGFTATHASAPETAAKCAPVTSYSRALTSAAPGLGGGGSGESPAIRPRAASRPTAESEKRRSEKQVKHTQSLLHLEGREKWSEGVGGREAGREGGGGEGGEGRGGGGAGGTPSRIAVAAAT